VYVTDTGKDRIYRVRGGPVPVLTDSALGGPNGITWDGEHGRFIIVPYFRGNTVHAWTPGSDSLVSLATTAGGQLDGVEMLDGGRILVASQKDSGLRIVTMNSDTVVVRVGGEPADIAVDTKRHRVAVPMIAHHAVGIWDIPR
jgi:sugar lactone lactonase YvrE